MHLLKFTESKSFLLESDILSLLGLNHHHNTTGVCQITNVSFEEDSLCIKKKNEAQNVAQMCFIAHSYPCLTSDLCPLLSWLGSTTPRRRKS